MPIDKASCFFASILDFGETDKAGDDCFDGVDLELLFDEHLCPEPLVKPSLGGGYPTHMFKGHLHTKMVGAAETAALPEKKDLPRFVARVIPQRSAAISRGPDTPAQFEADEARDLRVLREDFESAERMERIPRRADTAYNPNLDDGECGSGSDDELKRLFDGLRIRHLLESGRQQATAEQHPTTALDRSSVKRNRRS